MQCLSHTPLSLVALGRPCTAAAVWWVFRDGRNDWLIAYLLTDEWGNHTIVQPHFPSLSELVNQSCYPNTCTPTTVNTAVNTVLKWYQIKAGRRQGANTQRKPNKDYHTLLLSRRLYSEVSIPDIIIDLESSKSIPLFSNSAVSRLSSATLHDSCPLACTRRYITPPSRREIDMK